MNNYRFFAIKNEDYISIYGFEKGQKIVFTKIKDDFLKADDCFKYGEISQVFLPKMKRYKIYEISTDFKSIKRWKN